MSRRAAWAVLMLLAALLPGTPVRATGRSVTIEQYAYGPSSLMVTVGDTVTWTNRDTAAHDVVTTSGPASFRSKLLAKGQSYSYTFTVPGTYQYYCSVHPTMRASVMVHAKASPTTTAPRPSATRTPRRSTTTAARPPATAPPPSAPATTPAVALPAAPGGTVDSGTDLHPLAVATVAAVLAALASLFVLGTGEVRRERLNPDPDRSG
jgi:amicyanin